MYAGGVHRKNLYFFCCKPKTGLKKIYYKNNWAKKKSIFKN